MNGRAFIATVLLTGLVVSAVAIFASVHAEPLWSIQTVTYSTAGTGSNGYCPIVVDSNNIPHIAYTGRSNDFDSVVYTSWMGSSWSTQEIRGDAAFSLALDANNHPYILYIAGQTIDDQGGLRIAKLTGSSWDIQTVDEQGANYGALALDSSGNPHVAYISGKEIRYASKTGSNWTIQTIETSPDTLDIILNRGLSLKLDSNNTPYVLYSIPSSYVENDTGISIRSENVKLATYQDSKWNIQAVLTSSNLSEHGNLVLDAKDYPHFICTQTHSVSVTNTTLVSNLLYAGWNGSSWTTQTADSNIRLLDGIGFLALDSHDYPSISYVTLPSPTTQSEQYASWTGVNWTIQTVADFTAKTSGYLAVGSNDIPHLTYLVGGSNDRTIQLIYATPNEPTPIVHLHPL
jgi:hypothetical protein